MENKQLLEQLSALEVHSEPEKVSCRDLTAPEGYPILSVKRVSSRFGAAIAVDIVMPGGETAVTFLPHRFVNKLTDLQIEQLNKGGFRLRCSGMTGRSINVKIY